MCFDDRNFIQQAAQETLANQADDGVEMLRALDELHARAQAGNKETLAYLLDMAKLEAVRLIYEKVA